MNLFARLSRSLQRGLFILAALASAALLTERAQGWATPPAQEEFKVTTVFLIRHAERADAPREDPPLSESGRQRSQELARMLGSSGIKALYTSQFLRTKQTAEPLAKQLGVTATPITLKVKPSNPREIADESTAEIVNKIYERAGDTALVIGHSNSIPDVIRMLGGDMVPTIDEKKFDDLFIVTVYGKGKAKVLQLKYGSQS